MNSRDKCNFITSLKAIDPIDWRRSITTMQIMLREREWQSELVITRFEESMMETTVINRSLGKKKKTRRNRKRGRQRETKRFREKKERIINHPKEWRNHDQLKTRRNKSDDHWKMRKKAKLQYHVPASLRNIKKNYDRLYHFIQSRN